MDERDERIRVLEEENRVLKELVAVMTTEIARLTSKIAELEARLKKNSRNSNKPPSSDGPGKRVIKNSRVPSGKQTGGQLGHEGRTKMLNPAPDTIIELKPSTECGCGGQIIIQTDGFIVRQVTDMQPARQQHLLIKMQNQAVTCRFIHYCWFFHRLFQGNPVKESPLNPRNSE